MNVKETQTECIVCRKLGISLTTRHIRRNLCDTHYQAFMREKALRSKIHSPELLKQWEDRLIDLGLLGESGKRGRAKSTNIYSDTFDQMLNELSHKAAEDRLAFGRVS